MLCEKKMEKSCIERLQRFYTEYKFSIVRITVKDPSGDLKNGTGFHIGEGCIVTAKHVLEGNEIDEIVGNFKDEKWTLKETILPDDTSLDLAILKTNFNLGKYMDKTFKHPPLTSALIKKQDSIPCSWYLSDCCNELVLSRVLLFGYPRIPHSEKSDLIAISGEINAFVNKYGDRHKQFVISIPPRGGYSGGPVISEFGQVIGVATESLFKDDEKDTAGLFSVLAIDELLNFMTAKKIFPEGYNEEEWYEPGGPGHKTK